MLIDERPTTTCPPWCTTDHEVTSPVVLLVGAERYYDDPEEVPCDVCRVGWVDRYGRCDEWTCVLGGCQDEEEPA